MKNTLFVFLLMVSSILRSQTSFIEVLDNSYVLTSNEVDARNKLFSQDSIAEASWLVKINSIQDYLSGNILIVSLPDIVAPLTFYADGVTSKGLSDYYWAGYNQNGNAIQISRSVDGIVGKVYVSSMNRYYGIFSLSLNTAQIIKYNPNYIRPGDVCDDSFDDNCPENLEDGIFVEDRSGCTRNVIRVLYLFSPAAIARIPSITAFANMLIGEINTACISSGVPTFNVEFELANALPLLGFVESPCSPVTKNLLLNNSTAKALREANYADIVCLIIDNVSGTTPPCDASGSAVNFADKENAYCFAEIRTATTEFKATHGIGHIIGLRHQRCSNCFNIRCSGAHPLSSVHAFKINSSFRTIMADCTGPIRITRWSANGVPFMGSATGNEDNDNAKQMRNRARGVVCFMSDPPPAPCPACVPIFGSPDICEGVTNTYYITYGAGSAGIIWLKRTNTTLWEQVGTGDVVSITAGSMETIYLKVIVPGFGEGLKTISVVQCVGETEDRKGADPPIDSPKIPHFFPNPVTNYLTVQGLEETDVISLTDINGKELQKITGVFEFGLDTHSFKNGIYFLSVFSRNSSSHFKVVKQ